MILPPTPLEGKDASTKQSVESPEARPQPSVDTPTEEEDTRPKVLIRDEWRKVPDGYPADASGQLERDQLFIDDMCKYYVLCGLGVPSLRSLWGAVRNRQLYILRMYCKGCISFNFSIFFIIYTTYRKKKLHAFTAKKNYTTRRFFCTRLTFFTFVSWGADLRFCFDC